MSAFSRKSGIVAGGNWIIDRVKVIDAWPAQDALATILDEVSGNGGSAYNILKNLSRLGASFPLEAIGLVGDDAAGALIREDCRAHGIDSEQLRVTREAPTSYTDVMTDQRTRRRTFFHHRGANALLGPEHFDFERTSARIFHLGYLLLLDALDELGADGAPRALDVLRRATAAGLTTSIDCVSEDSQRFASVVTPVLPHIDVLFANDFEAERLTGLSVGRGKDLNVSAVEAAARELINQGVRQWVIIHVPEGACAVSRSGEVLWQPAVDLPTVEIAGTAGAGDAFASGVLLAVHEGESMSAALELGVCAAAASLRHPTCSHAVMAASECIRAGRSHGFRSLPVQR